MNICFFSKEYPPDTHVGGIGTYTYNMAGALAQLGHTVHVITATGFAEQTYQENGVRVHRIHHRPFMPVELSLLKYSRAIAKTLSRLRCRFDILQSSEYGGEALWYSFHKKFPLITRLATPFFQLRRLNGRFFFGLRPFSNFMEKRQTLKSDGIFTSTRALANTVIQEWKLNPSKVEVIPNSVDVSRVIKLGKDRPAPKPLRISDYLLYFGRLEERKGVTVLARALPAVLEKYPSLRMVFVGSDLGYHGASMREYIKTTSKEYAERLLFFDNLPHEELFPIVNAAKIVLLPSLWEAFGFVCVEAMALGRPVIATSGSGFEEIIENNSSGYLVEPGNSRLLAEKMIRHLRDEEGLMRISDGARKRALDFEVSRVANQLLAYYDKIIEEWPQKRRRHGGR